MNIAISSGKGGTGKTFIATNLARIFSERFSQVCYLDCDVEEPNGHLFLSPQEVEEEEVKLPAPSEVDEQKCINCGKCAEVCSYNAIAVLKNKVLIFKELCHACGACSIVCPANAIVEKERKIGVVKKGKNKNLNIYYALLGTAEGGMSPRLVKKVRAFAGEGINLLDSSPGTSCPVVETVKEGQEPVVVVNRAEYMDTALKEYCDEEQLDIIGEIPDERRVAEAYSRGELAVERFPEFKDMFGKLADKILILAGQKREVKKRKKTGKPSLGEITKSTTKYTDQYVEKPKELVVISGKGGTGKTSLTASFAALAKPIIISDCDVDAADLHLVLSPQVEEKGFFSGGVEAKIDQARCVGCGRCKEACKFAAVEERNQNGKKEYIINKLACEGCGVCKLVCEYNAVKTKPAVNGEWFVSDTRHGPMSHAKLGVAEENSGRLVTLVRENSYPLAKRINKKRALIDGAPGTGCPVISSITGADFALVVTEPTVSGMHDLERVFQLVKHFGVRSGVVVNKYDLNQELTEEIEELAKRYHSEFMGRVPYGKEVTEAQMQKLSVVEYTNTALTDSIKEIWKKIDKIYQ
ncbi:MAG: cobyrinic acid ac-diamide synthase [Candidatus Omnitrophica bacterium 4484_213]|nr:MAG: cobyrinic acid ac-diamide synthase [Candidatus Omnitrophica bacterium 4484_213]